MSQRAVYRTARRSEAASPAIVLAFAFLAIASCVDWVWRDLNLPYRSYMGEEAYAIVR